MAALDRLGLAPTPMDVLDVDVMVPQVAQGALAVECRADDGATCELVKHARRAPLPALRRRRAVLPGVHRRRLRPPCGRPRHHHAGWAGYSSRAYWPPPMGVPWSAERPWGRWATAPGSGPRWPGWSSTPAGATSWRPGTTGVDPGEPGDRSRRGGVDRTVYLVGAGPGDPGLLTRRGAELLAAADVVVHDRLTGPALLSLAPPTAEKVDVGKQPDDRGDQEAINELLVARARGGLRRRAPEGGRPVRFRAGRGGGAGTASRRDPFRGGPGRERRYSCARQSPAYPSLIAASSLRSPSSPATPAPSARRPRRAARTGRPWPRSEVRSWS